VDTLEEEPKMKNCKCGHYISPKRNWEKSEEEAGKE